MCVCLQVQERLKLFRRNSEGAGGSLAYQYRNCTRGQVNPRGVCVCEGEREKERERKVREKERERKVREEERERKVREEEREGRE